MSLAGKSEIWTSKEKLSQAPTSGAWRGDLFDEGRQPSEQMRNLHFKLYKLKKAQKTRGNLKDTSTISVWPGHKVPPLQGSGAFLGANLGANFWTDTPAGSMPCGVACFEVAALP